jgi:PKD repeat protein
MQLMFDNRIDNCALADTDTQPTVSIHVNPNTPVPHTAATFTAEVTAPAGVGSIEWSFGDGGSASGASVEHTYANAGPEDLTVLVTDEHGNEKQLTKEIAVSFGGGGEQQSGEGGGGSADSGGPAPASQPASATTTNVTSTAGPSGSANRGAKAAGKPKPRCATVDKRIHGHRRKVKICAAAKPKVKPGKARGKRG